MLKFHLLPYDDHILYFAMVMSYVGFQSLKTLFRRYALASGQIINASNSTIFSCSIAQDRLDQIVDLLGFNISCLLFIYFGFQVFKGNPKTIHLQGVAYKIKSKLSSLSLIDIW